MIGQQLRLKKITNLLHQTQKIRNVSIVAHVDHGKTTLADCLISSNGLIHKKQAGQLKLLDDRLDQQDRGITMKSSSISLVYQDHLVNLIDSPGHLQFYSQVSSALRLTDSALLVIDVVEGVSSQTFRVLKQLYNQKLPAILILNKLDKLITQCKMDPQQAYNHINQIIQRVNAVLGSFINKQVNIRNIGKTKSQDLSQENIIQLQSMFYFSAQKRNIIFGTALDNWGFSPQTFAQLIAKKIGTQPQKIVKYLWGDFYFNPKTKQFSQNPRNQNDKPICIDFVLRPIWDIYENVLSKNIQKVDKIINTLGIKVSQNARKNYNTQFIKQILTNWIPIDKVVMKKIIQILPNPIKAQAFRLPYLLQLNSNKEQVNVQIVNALSKCSSVQDVPFISFISKMVNIPKNHINQRGLNLLQGEGDIRALGFGRIFSGTIKRGDQIFVIGNKKKKIENQKGQTIQVNDINKVRVQNLYIFSAQYPQGIQQAYAGNIVGFSSLDDYIFKSGTISSSKDCISFIPVVSQTKSILKVSVSTQNIEDNKKLLQGLKKLNKSDPSVDIYVQSTGDIILNTCGQVHLQKCVVDLENIYCKVPIKTSQPIINFRQTIIWTNPNQNKNQKYIQEIQRKKQQLYKKQLRQKYKEQLRNDAQLDQNQKQKLRAVKQWDSHVQIYQSQDLTVQDTRFFFKNRDDEEQQKYNYKKDKEDNKFKKIDHKNKGKLHQKQKFKDLNLKTNVDTKTIPNGRISFKVKALGLQFQVAQFLEKNSDRMKKLFLLKRSYQKMNIKQDINQQQNQIKQQKQLFLKQLNQKMKQFSVDPTLIKMIQQKLVCFSNYHGTNMLLIKSILKSQSFFNKQINSNYKQIKQKDQKFQFSQETQKILEQQKMSHNELLNSIILGFNLTCDSGPLCSEQLMGVIFIIEQIKGIQVTKEQVNKQIKLENLNQNLQKSQSIQQQSHQIKLEQNKSKPKQQLPQDHKKDQMPKDVFGPLAGQIMGTIKDTCLQAFLGASPRLVQPMYLVQLHTQQQYYGNVHNQLSKRRSKIIEQDLHQITNLFIIKAHLPILQSGRFCFEMLDKTSGTVNAQLNFDTWKIYPQDPFYIPFTQEDIEDEGVDNIVPNAGKILLQKIRNKKGLAGIEKIVVKAQGQRTLKKN